MNSAPDNRLMYWEMDLALRISRTLHYSPEHKRLDHLMEDFRPYLKELAAQLRRSEIRRVK